MSDKFRVVYPPQLPTKVPEGIDQIIGYSPSLGKTVRFSVTTFLTGKSIPLWEPSPVSYDTGLIVEFGLRLWKSLIDDNEDNVPTEGAVWTEVSEDETSSTATPQAIFRNIFKEAHGFVVKDVLTLDVTGTLVKVTDPINQKRIGIVSEVTDVDSYTLVLSGYLTGLSGLAPGVIYYAQPSGTIGTTETGMPVLQAASETTAYLLSSGGVSSGGGPAIDEKYTNIAALLADQANQEEDALYFVLDASADATVDAGWALYQKLTATTGAIGDYRKLSEQESLDVIFTVSNASETVKGLVEEATDAEVAAGTATGSTGAKLFVSAQKLITWWTNIKTAAQTIAATWTFTGVKVSGQAAASTKKNTVHITDDGTLAKSDFIEHDTTNKKVTQTGVDDLDTTVQHEWKNQSGTWLMRIYNGFKIAFNGSVSFFEVIAGIPSGSAGIIFLTGLDIAYRLKDGGSFDYLIFKSSTTGYGRALIFKQKIIYNEDGAGFETIRRQFSVTTDNTAGATTTIGSISVPNGYSLLILINKAKATATGGRQISCQPFIDIGENVSGTTAGTNTAPTSVRRIASTGTFGNSWNNTTDACDIVFTNETSTGYPYKVEVDLEYILTPIP